MPVLAESSGAESRVFQKDLAPYAPEFGKRLTDVLAKAPLWGILSGPSGWTPEFRTATEKADRVSRREQVCAHGIDTHLLQVTRNAFVLADAIAPSSERETTVLNDTNLTFLSLTHDLGYADPSISWDDKKAPGHIDASIVWLDRTRQKTRSPFNPSANRSLNVLDENIEMYSSVMRGMSEDSLKKEQTSPRKRQPTPVDLLTQAVTFADKADFFRAGRLAGLDTPPSYDANPYFFLADAVRDYSLDAGDGKLTYSVELQRGWTFERWKKEVETQGYGWVLGTGRQFARSLGLEFEVQEMPLAASLR
ncbi:MAG TPA: hypothetical protein VNA13_00340 [Xanthomonadales bacterium]|nr:hypothetical protein [Xanthomonadales bacterium]